MRASAVDVGGARAGDWRAQGLWPDETVESYLDRWATQRPDRTAMVDGENRCTWAQLARRVERVAHGFAAHGVEPGGVIACQLPNWSKFVVVLLAAARLGAVANPIPPIYRARELRFMLNHLEAVALVIRLRERVAARLAARVGGPLTWTGQDRRLVRPR